jgi:hypothetical protein
VAFLSVPLLWFFICVPASSILVVFRPPALSFFVASWLPLPQNLFPIFGLVSPTLLFSLFPSSSAGHVNSITLCPSVRSALETPPLAAIMSLVHCHPHRFLAMAGLFQCAPGPGCLQRCAIHNIPLVRMHPLFPSSNRTPPAACYDNVVVRSNPTVPSYMPFTDRCLQCMLTSFYVYIRTHPVLMAGSHRALGRTLPVE